VTIRVGKLILQSIQRIGEKEKEAPHQAELFQVNTLKEKHFLIENQESIVG
jgi:hypothetical protein